MIPGEYILQNDDIIANNGKPTVDITVVNTGDRPVQIGSHFHFFEINKQLLFDRSKAFGMHLNIPAGTAVRFEPGEEKQVTLVAYGGNKKVFGFNNLVDGDLSAVNRKSALEKALSQNFKNQP
ncbi:MAG TPA: urease subunit beta [Chitinophagaceae bacterium]|nr:urease subunit beta [Chitinophagaceae bacterium]